MRNYILKRILLIPLTLFGILCINFFIIQMAPGGPVEYMLAKYRGMNVDATSSLTSTSQMNTSQHSESSYQGAQGVPDYLVEELKKQFGFDKPIYVRFLKMIKRFSIDLGEAAGFYFFRPMVDFDYLFGFNSARS